MRGQTNASSRFFAKQLRKRPTDAERMLWQKLRFNPAGVKFRRQHPYGLFILDFVCLEKRVALEVDGSQHMDMTEEDAERSLWLKQAGFQVLRFWNNEVLNEIEGVLDAIYEALNSPAPGSRTYPQTHPHPGPPLEGEGVVIGAKGHRAAGDRP